MQTIVRQRQRNPRLGIYFGIFTSLVVALVLVVLLLEMLGGGRWMLGALMLAVPLMLYTAIGVAARCDDIQDYFAVGRRVPSFYNGTLLAITAIGGTGFVALTGAFFLHGFDAWAIGSGIVAGFVVMGVLVAPFLRKYGGFTLPGYFGRRFESRAVRIVCAVVLAVPMLLVLTAEMLVARDAIVSLVGTSATASLTLVALTLFVTLSLGGMRSLTWSVSAQAIAAVLAIVVPASLVAVLAGNLPLPQLSHGPTVRAIGRLETLQGVPIPILNPLSFEIAGTTLASVGQRIAHPFGSMGPAAYVLTSLIVMAGIAGAPWLVMRAVTTPGVYQTRKSQGWATLIAGIILLTLSANAVFMRDYVMETVVGQDALRVPLWFQTLVGSGHAAVDTMSTRIPLQAIAFKRDSVLMALPAAAAFPAALHDTVLAGVIAAALAGASAGTLALAAVVSEDVIGSATKRPLAAAQRILLARLAVAGVLGVGVGIVLSVPIDPLQHLLWALALSAATVFPVLVMSIWWKRINAVAAMSSMVLGLVVTLLAILAGEAGLTPFKSILAGGIGVCAATACALMVAQLTAPPTKHELELVQDLRVPGGETIHDRDIRIERLKQRHGG